MNKPLLRQIKKRRIELGLKQNDMMLRVGISRQQYQHLESKGNPTLDTLELIAEGLNSKLMLIPKEKLNAVKKILDAGLLEASQQPINIQKKELYDDPWEGLLGDQK